MCYTSVYHFTTCDTRRPAIINPSTGEAIMHPLELPQGCDHILSGFDKYNLNDIVPCPVHGTCCFPGQIFVCVRGDGKSRCDGWQANHQILDPSLLPKWREHLAPITARDWGFMEDYTDGFAYEEDIRRQFFDAGASMWAYSRMGSSVIEDFRQYVPSSSKQEEEEFLAHGEMYWEWMVARKELLQLTEAWESLASVGCMEVCPAKLLAAHPHKHVFRKCDERQPVEFPQFIGLPFTHVENCQRQDDILRWHPYYAGRDKPSTPTAVDRLWRSPAPPQGRNAEPVSRAERPGEAWSGDWEGILAATRNSLPLRDYNEANRHRSIQAGYGSASPQSDGPLSTASSGPQIPPWVIPYGEEPFIPWKEIHWDRPATLIDSPPVSPKTVPPPKTSMSAVPISSLPYDATEENSFMSNPFVGNEEPALQDFLLVSVSGEVDGGTRRPKRRWSVDGLGDGGEEVNVAKRNRTI
ncbi:hypothetical protein FLONG3_9761 [Fusarium longipes]|uniref:Uncharacterized protein n=1 Tax=Fusarium longipes TaxID=694270 RepID=A0A395RV18_9HYPO|nr:hypothetical protein FLONG3_9761 [Fusarium longipes]